MAGNEHWWLRRCIPGCGAPMPGKRDPPVRFVQFRPRRSIPICSGAECVHIQLFRRDRVFVEIDLANGRFVTPFPISASGREQSVTCKT